MSDEWEIQKEIRDYKFEVKRRRFFAYSTYFAMASAAVVICLAHFGASIVVNFTLNLLSSGTGNATSLHYVVLVEYAILIAIAAGFSLVFLVGVMSYSRGGEGKNLASANCLGWLWIAAVAVIVIPVALSGFGLTFKTSPSTTPVNPAVGQIADLLHSHTVGEKSD